MDPESSTKLKQILLGFAAAHLLIFSISIDILLA